MAKTLAGGGGGVAQGVQRVGTAADLLRQAAHLSNAAGIVGHGAVGVGGQGDAQGGEHAHACDADAVKTAVEGLGKGAGLIHNHSAAASGKVAHQHRRGHDQNGGQSGLQSQGNAADDDGGGAGLGGGGQFLGGLVRVRSVVLGEVADGAAADEAAEDGDVHAPAAQDEIGQGSRQHGRQHGGGVGAGAQALEQGLLGGVLLGLHQERAQDGADNAAHGQSHRQQHAVKAVSAHGAQGKGGQDRAHIGLVQVCAHAGHVTHVVAHIVAMVRGSGGHPPGYRPPPCPPGPRPRRRPWYKCRRPHGRRGP
mgnify:CR=1 FL=1